MLGVSHPLQLTTGLVIKSVTTSPTLAGERMLLIPKVSILSEQSKVRRPRVNGKGISEQCSENTTRTRWRKEDNGTERTGRGRESPEQRKNEKKVKELTKRNTEFG